MAIRMPISRVRSVTETSIIFIMPMPPTRREIAATLTSRSVNDCWTPCTVWRICDRFHHSKSIADPPDRAGRPAVVDAPDRRHAHEQERQRLLDALHGLEDLRLILNGEIVLLWSSDVVALLQQLLNRGLHIVDMCCVIRKHVNGIDSLAARESLLRSAERHKDDIVRIAEAARCSLGDKRANNGKGHIADANLLANGVDAQWSEQTVHDLLAKHSNCADALLVSLRDEGPFLRLPTANLLITRVDSLYLRRPVLVAEYHLPADIYHGTDSSHVGYLCSNGIGISLCERLQRACALPHAKTASAARPDDELIRTQAREALVDGGRVALAAGNDHNHRGHPYDNAKRGEQRAEHIGS